MAFTGVAVDGEVVELVDDVDFGGAELDVVEIEGGDARADDPG